MMVMLCDWGVGVCIDCMCWCLCASIWFGDSMPESLTPSPSRCSDTTASGEVLPATFGGTSLLWDAIGIIDWLVAKLCCCGVAALPVLDWPIMAKPCCWLVACSAMGRYRSISASRRASSCCSCVARVFFGQAGAHLIVPFWATWCLIVMEHNWWLV